MRLLLRAGGVLGVRGIGMAAQFLLLVLAARTLSLAAVGYFSAVVTVMMFSRQLGPLGSDVLLMSHARDGEDADVQDSVAARLALALLPRVLLWSSLGAVVSVVFLLWDSHGSDTHLSAGGAALVAFTMLAAAVSGVGVGVLRARHSAVVAQLPESMIQPVVAVAVYAAAPLVGIHHSLDFLILSQALGVAVSLACYGGIIAIAGLGSAADRDAHNEFRRSALVILRGMVWNTVGSRAGTLFVLVFGSAQAAALYGAAQPVQLVGTNVTWALGIASAPSFAAAHRRGDRAGLERQLAHGTFLAVAPSAVVVIAVVAIGPRIMELFGSSYRSAFATAVVLAVGALLTASTALAGYLYNVTGQEAVCTRANFFQLIAVCVTSPVLTLAMGSTGAALGLVAGVVVRNLLLNRWLRPSLGIRPGMFVVVTILARRLGWRRGRASTPDGSGHPGVHEPSGPTRSGVRGEG